MRICARYLYDVGLVGLSAFSITTNGGPVTATILDEGAKVKVAMGQARFPDNRPLRLDVDGTTFDVHLVSMGNPHCVVLMAADEVLTRRLGPQIEAHQHFPDRTNVQYFATSRVRSSLPV